MNVKKKPEPAIIGPNLINEVAYGVMILFVEWLSVGILECTLISRASVGIDEGAIEVSNDHIRRFFEDIEQQLGDSPRDRASETIGVRFKPAIGGQPRSGAWVGDAGRLLIAAVRAGEDRGHCASVTADQISLFITDSPHRFTFSLLISIHLFAIERISRVLDSVQLAYTNSI